jgi:hypothetical protein
MHLAPALLVFGIQGLNAFYSDAHHCLVANRARQSFVAHAGYMEISIAPVDSSISWWSFITKSFLEAAYLSPPPERVGGVGGG